jgi:hypothetical protein
LRGGTAGFVLDQPFESDFADNVVPDCGADFRAAAAADVNGDGLDEAVVFYECDESSPLMMSVVSMGGDGIGFVTGMVNVQVSADALDPFRVQIGDVDGDGKVDAMVQVIGTSSEGVLVVWNEMLAGDTAAAPASATIADLDDLALINADEDAALEIAVLQFGSVGIADVDVQARTIGAVAPKLVAGDATGRLLVGDVNKDGLNDLVVFPRVFLMAPLDPAQAGRETCSLSEQTGCEDGQTCDLNGKDIECRLPGVGTETTECRFIDECAAGYSCISPSSVGRSQCLPWCGGDEDCEGPGGACDFTINAAGVVIPGAVTCTPNCDQLTNEGCPAGWGCKVVSHSADVTRMKTICLPAGGGGQAAACASDTDCAAEFTCVNTPGTCARNCLVAGGGTECGLGETCVTFTTPHVLGGVEYGVCL